MQHRDPKRDVVHVVRSQHKNINKKWPSIRSPFFQEHQDLAKRPSPERRRAPGTPSMPGRHHGAHGAHGAHGVGGGALRPMTGQRSLPVLDTAEAGALRRMRSLPQLVVGGGKGQNLPRLAWHPDGSPKKGYG